MSTELYSSTSLTPYNMPYHLFPNSLPTYITKVNATLSYAAGTPLKCTLQITKTENSVTGTVYKLQSIQRTTFT